MSEIEISENRTPLLNYLSFPMGNGDVISRAWRLYRLNICQYIYFWIFPALLQVVIVKLAFYAIEKASNNSTLSGSYFELMGTSVLLIFFANTILIYFAVAYSQSFINSLLGREFSFKFVFNQLRKKYLRFIGLTLSVLFDLIIFLTALAIVIPFAIGLLAFFYAAFYSWYTFIFMAVLAVLLLSVIRKVAHKFLSIGMQIVIALFEDVKLKECSNIATTQIEKKANKSALLGLCLLGMVIMYIFLGLQLPWTIYSIVEFFNYKIVNDIIVLVITSVFDIITTLIIWPLVLATIIIYYFNLKSMDDGYDLQVALATEKSTFDKN